MSYTSASLNTFDFVSQEIIDDIREKVIELDDVENVNVQMNGIQSFSVQTYSNNANQLKSNSNETNLGLSASDLMQRYPNLPLAALGMLLMNDMVAEKMQASNETMRLQRLSATMSRQTLIDKNNAALESLRGMESNYNAGTSPSGATISISKEQRELIEEAELPWYKRLWKKIVRFLIKIVTIIVVVLVTLVAPMLGALLVLGLLVAIMFGSQIVQLLINAKIIKEGSELASKLNDLINFLTPFSTIVDLAVSIVTEIVIACDKDNAKKHLERAKLATTILTEAAFALAMVAASVAIGVVTGGAGAGASIAGIVNVVSSIASIIGAVLSIVNGVFNIINGVRALKNAEKMFTYKMLMNVIDNIRHYIETLQAAINDIIENMNQDLSVLKTGWDQASQLIKAEGETKIGIARNISI